MPLAGDIHYRRSKRELRSKPPLILIHGAGGSYLHWPTELRRLPGEDVIAIDLPGHGASKGEARNSIGEYSEDVLGLLDHLDINQGVIAGHSMGGAIAMQLCLDYPESVRGLILIGAGTRLAVNPKLIQGCIEENKYPQVVSQVVNWSFSPYADPRLVELAGERLEETPAKVLLADFSACDAFDVRSQVTKIGQPVLVICGEQDKMTPVRFSQFLLDRISNARLEIVPKAGHMVMLEQPGTVAKLVQEFLEDIKLLESDKG